MITISGKRYLTMTDLARKLDVFPENFEKHTVDHYSQRIAKCSYINGQRAALNDTLKMVRDRNDGLTYQVEDLYKQGKTPHYAEGLCTAFAIVESYLVDELVKLLQKEMIEAYCQHDEKAVGDFRERMASQECQNSN